MQKNVYQTLLLYRPQERFEIRIISSVKNNFVLNLQTMYNNKLILISLSTSDCLNARNTFVGNRLFYLFRKFAFRRTKLFLYFINKTCCAVMLNNKLIVTTKFSCFRIAVEEAIFL